MSAHKIPLYKKFIVQPLEPAPAVFPIPPGELVKIDVLQELLPVHPKCAEVSGKRVMAARVLMMKQGETRLASQLRNALMISFCLCLEHQNQRRAN